MSRVGKCNRFWIPLPFPYLPNHYPYSYPVRIPLKYPGIKYPVLIPGYLDFSNFGQSIFRPRYFRSRYFGQKLFVQSFSPKVFFGQSVFRTRYFRPNLAKNPTKYDVNMMYQNLFFWQKIDLTEKPWSKYFWPN